MVALEENNSKETIEEEIVLTAQSTEARVQVSHAFFATPAITYSIHHETMSGGVVTNGTALHDLSRIPMNFWYAANY